MIQIEFSCFLLSFSLARIPVYSRSIETRKYKGKIKIRFRQKIAQICPAENEIA